MRVFNKTFCMVKPADQTWSGKLALSELDQTGLTTHVPTIYFYKQSPEDWLIVLQTLKASLSSTLVHFFPLAGRLSFITRGRLELDCNGTGVQFLEAYADANLADLDSLLPSPVYHQLIPSIDYQNTPLEEIPLLVLQVTRFVCGGFSLGLSISHAVADGQSALHFVSEWARVSRGELVETPPYLDRKVLRAGDPPRTLKMVNHEQFCPPPVLIDGENERENETTVTMLKLTATQVEKLRNKANQIQKSEVSRGFTRYEAITAHIWRTSCKARKHKPEQPTALAFCVDIRNKMRPPLPQKYFGNAIVNMIATGCSGEIVSNPLGFVSSKIRDAIKNVDDEYVNSVIDFLKNQDDLSRFRELIPTSGDEGHFYGNPNVGVISWLTLPLYGADFGWGKEVHMGPGTHDSDGDSLILHGKDGDGSLVVALCLQVRHMEEFKKVFYQDIDM
ncbi:putative transferase [Helianthus annuus]|uniref:Transferase n=1 Tax=Helianthus annuus TaxID=4232 RepID=A0A251UM31_HELAN|nr:spermidine hydroxycinnamoyl transferase [Helianthus annuus]KAF5804672.1 putative transferase [Helianthus annuus]KAJ0569249.1 putative transferase [Helianthus annuus]KAJ0583558.1 putative transferase [Helianthus annuus]KAJ0746288.1 putative transferase [Helianthus annuus]KAJ0749289.1 putative transferase [Helianthus annuus]